MTRFTQIRRGHTSKVGGAKSRGTASKHYDTMSTKEICDLPIRNICTDKAVCFLWATFPNITEAIKVLEAWGFTYKTAAFVWIKKNKISDTLFWGMGAYTRASENPKDHKLWLVSYQDGGFVIDYKHKPKDKRKRSKCEIEVLCEDNIWLYGMEVAGNIYENLELLEEASNDN